MTDNDMVILDRLLDAYTTYPDLPENDQFELFAFERLLKDYDLSSEELQFGKVGGGADGGIDGFFTFVNGELINEVPSVEDHRPGPKIEVYLIQATRSPSFRETKVNSVCATISQLFALSEDLTSLKSYYNEDVLDRAQIFRDSYLELSKHHPILKITYASVSRGDTRKVSAQVYNKTKVLSEQIGNLFPGAEFQEQFLGARELIQAGRRTTNYTLQLEFREQLTGGDAYVLLADLPAYYDFITDKSDSLRRYILESNVRDYQGSVEVNKEIRDELASSNEIDFWLLNNGITILASKATVAGKTITIDNAEVVNGLQTTFAIYEQLKGSEGICERRQILLKIIVTEDAETRDRIIRATNRQTHIPPASFRANEKLQRDIEDFFKSHNVYYDRRKNHYKNMGKPTSQIISIFYLAQSVMAIILREPYSARAKPSSLIKKDSDYRRVFSEQTRLEAYLFCAQTMRKLDQFIRAGSDLYNDSDHDRHELVSLKWHLATVLMMRLVGKRMYGPEDVLQLVSRDIESRALNEAVAELNRLSREYRERENVTIAMAAKRPDFARYVLENASLGSAESS